MSGGAVEETIDTHLLSSLDLRAGRVAVSSPFLAKLTLASVERPGVRA